MLLMPLSIELKCAGEVMLGMVIANLTVPAARLSECCANTQMAVQH